MNEGNSAGGGHAGLSPAPPAVPDRVTLQSTEQSVTTPKLPQTTPQPPPPTASFSNASSSFDTKPLPSAQLPKPLSPFQQEQPTTEATAATPAAAAALGYTSTSPPQAKRQRLDNESIVGTVAANSSNIVGSLLPASVVAASTEIASPALQDLNALKKRILQQKLQILRNLKERHLENVSEYFYLQNGGSMMDYPAWRKKTPTPQFISYSNANRIDQLIHQEEKPTTSTAAAIAAVGAAVQPTETTNIIALGSTIGQQVVVSDGLKTNTQSQLPSSGSGSPLTTSTIISNSEAGGVGANVLPPEAEIKIPAVGATPVAISTKLPAAVVQLTQQGGTPLVPCGTTVTATPPTPTPTQTPTPLYTGNGPGTPSSSTTLLSPALASAAGTPQTAAQEFSFKAKQEVYVMQRISELQREGLWTERRLPKLQEPSRPKAHWDYLLEEMVWLAADFAQERKWKKNAAKKCAKMVQKYFQDKATAAQRAEKAQELQLKRVASFIAREVKSFWSNVEKLVEYKHQTKIEEKRKQALDQHLSFIVDQTEKFSQQLAEGMNKSVAETATPSLNSSRITTPKRESDDEFRPESGSEDDEETIAQAEQEAADVNEEVKALAKESQMDFDDFLSELPPGYLENRDKLLKEEQSSTTTAKSAADDNGDDTDDSEFQAKEASDDDENTISKQEEAEQEVDHQKEIDELEADNDLSVEQLMAKYQSGASNAKRRKLASERDSDDDSTAVEESSDDSEAEEEVSEDEDEVSTVKTDTDMEEADQEEGLKSLLTDNEESANTSQANTDAAASSSNKDDMLNDAAALAESLQPKGNTLSSTNVVTPVPFLLKHTLREYQHIGLDWLVTMNERKLNGILADEMGLGKTIQTIALLAHLACAKGNWGPHLIVVPSSVMLNWEMEFKKWCPGFKILTYYGSQKERKLKRVGWTKPNAFHVCITSYKLVVQDQQSFRRKKWKYLILDEAQNIKNFKSQRWQLLLNFSTDRRLLLTGTPLQNDLMELWSLMHFLMPYVFSSHREFKEWFSNPMTGMIEGNMEYNETLIARLHKVIRPFLLRRLKKEVEKQMPKKYEHVVMCRLSNRQRYLYEDFMSRSKTRETLQTGNLLSVINVLMQLRKVCNHPNMFEVRPTISPFQMEGITFHTPRLICDIMEYDPFTQIKLQTVNLLLLHLEQSLTAYVSHKSRLLAPPRKLIEEVDSAPQPAPRCPNGKYRFHIRVRSAELAQRIKLQAVRVGSSPAMRMEGSKLVPMRSLLPSGRLLKRVGGTINPVNMALKPVVINSVMPVVPPPALRSQINAPTPAKVAKTMQDGKPFFYLTPATNTGGAGARLTFTSKTASPTPTPTPTPPLLSNREPLVKDLASHVKQRQGLANGKSPELQLEAAEEDPYKMQDLIQLRKEQRLASLKRLAQINRRRTDATPIYGADCRAALERCMQSTHTLKHSTWQTRGYSNCQMAMIHRDGWSLNLLIKTLEQRCSELSAIFANYVIYVPSVCAPRIRRFVQNLSSTHWQSEREIESRVGQALLPKLNLLHPIISAMTTQFPDPRLIQYDCGKLQTLNRLLRQLKVEGHRVLIFTQMTKMLDVLEAFLNHHGHIYLRLDGSTRVEQRQILMERFNGDKRIFCFILSTRSGGVGINLTGADTVIFYDSDWNPTMDAQAQDRCHRIGQTRDVHIYRLVSEKTIEVNILKKANQKRMLSDMAIEGGNFTTTFFKSSTIKDLFNMEEEQQQQQQPKLEEKEKLEPEPEKQSLRAFEHALAAAEDEQDVQATKTAKAEVAADLAEFDENIPIGADEANPEAGGNAVELSKADLEMQNIVKQLSPIERYAMRFVEATGAAWSAEQLRAAEAELEAQKREWEANRLAAMHKEEELLKQETEAEELLTYSRKDSSNQVWISRNTMEQMPMWCPPTPPQDNDNDIYIDHSLSFMYDLEPIPEPELPPVYVSKEKKRSRTEAGYEGSRRPHKMRREDNYVPPRSLFDRPTAQLARLRRDLKSQRFRGSFKPNSPIPGLKPQMPAKPLAEPEAMSEWCIFEDIAILHVLINLQGLPCSLMLLSPGQTPNWDLVSEMVNFCAKTYRSARQCRWRYETHIQPREEGKVVESPKKQKKLKATLRTEYMKSPLRYLRTTQMYASDNNSSFYKVMRTRFDTIKTAYLKKAPPPKRQFNAPSLMNPKHMEVLQEFGICNYDQPVSPMNIALMKANKMREKQQRGAPAQVQPQPVVTPAPAPLPVPQQQVQSQPPPPPPTPVEVTVPPAPGQLQQLQIQHLTTANVSPGQQTAILLQQQPQLRTHNQVVTQATNSQQMVKTLVSTSSSLTANQLQQLASNTGQSSVSVVLTTPVQSLPTVVQTQTPSGAQIVSISSQTTLPVNTAPQLGSIVQTQTLPQVVSVSSLPTVGSVLTTTAGQQQTSAVTTLNTAMLRGQRIVSASTTAGQALPQRTALPGQSLVPTQFQTQLRLAAVPTTQANQTTTTQLVTTKGIPVSALQQGGKTVQQPGAAHIQLYRQRSLKVLQTAPPPATNAPNTIIQTTNLPTHVTSQKVPLATTVQAGNVVSSVQMQGQARTQFIKQMAAGKQSIQRQVVSADGTTTTTTTTSGDMLLVKRHQILAAQKAQQQATGALFTTTASPQQQQQQAQLPVAGQPQQVTQQQIASLVKASTAAAASGSSVSAGGVTVSATGPPSVQNMSLPQLKPGSQIKVTMPNQMRHLQMQQQLTMPRKISRMTQLVSTSGQPVATQAQQQGTGTLPTVAAQQQQQQQQQKAVSSGAGSVQAQLLHIQNTKSLPNSVTVQQIQQVMRSGQPGTLATTNLVLGKTSVGRVIPVSVASQVNQRQTIQVVSAASAQALAAGNLRTHVSGQNIASALKVAASGGANQATQQTLIAALQQNQRQNASPVRLQTTAGGNLLAVVQQQQQQQQNLAGPSAGPAEVMTITQTSGSLPTVQQQQQLQQQQQQGVTQPTTQQHGGSN